MNDNITGVIDLGVASSYLISFLLRSLVGHAEPIYTVSVTTSTIGNQEGTIASEIDEAIYLGGAQFSVNSDFILTAITLPVESFGDITEILLISGDDTTGNVVFRVPLEYVISKRSGFSLELRLRTQIKPCNG